MARIYLSEVIPPCKHTSQHSQREYLMQANLRHCRKSVQFVILPLWIPMVHLSIPRQLLLRPWSPQISRQVCLDCKQPMVMGMSREWGHGIVLQGRKKFGIPTTVSSEDNDEMTEPFGELSPSLPPDGENTETERGLICNLHVGEERILVLQ